MFDPSAAPRGEDDKMLWMGDLEPYMDADFIADAFRRMGESINVVRFVYDKYTGKQAGYCFVELDSGDACRRCMLNINGKVIPKSRPPTVFHLSFASSPSSPYTEYNIIVSNLADDVTDEELFKLFGERYGSCRGAKVHRYVDGTSKGTGHVRFTDAIEQQQAIVDLSQATLRGKQLTMRLSGSKFTAPRGSRYYGSTLYDPIMYYPAVEKGTIKNIADHERKEQQDYENRLRMQPMPVLLDDGTVEFPSYGTTMIPPPSSYGSVDEPMVKREKREETLGPGGFRMPLPPKPVKGASESVLPLDARYHYEMMETATYALPPAPGEQDVLPTSVQIGPNQAQTDKRTGVTMINAPKRKKNNTEDANDEQQQENATRPIQQQAKRTNEKETSANAERGEEKDDAVAAEEITIDDAAPSSSAENDGAVVEVPNGEGGDESKVDENKNKNEAAKKKPSGSPQPDYTNLLIFELPDEDDADTLDESNAQFMTQAEEYYGALIESRWTERLLAASVKQQHLFT